VRPFKASAPTFQVSTPESIISPSWTILEPAAFVQVGILAVAGAVVTGIQLRK
jgi:hypothetical protein